MTPTKLAHLRHIVRTHDRKCGCDFCARAVRVAPLMVQTERRFKAIEQEYTHQPFPEATQ